MTESENDEIFKDLFPEEWICPYCLAECEEITKIKNKNILTHVKGEHQIDKKTTWKQFYHRMSAVGGL